MYVCIEKVNNLRKKYFPIKSSYLKATQKVVELSFNFMWRSIRLVDIYFFVFNTQNGIFTTHNLKCSIKSWYIYLLRYMSFQNYTIWITINAIHRATRLWSWPRFSMNGLRNFIVLAHTLSPCHTTYWLSTIRNDYLLTTRLDIYRKTEKEFWPSRSFYLSKKAYLDLSQCNLFYNYYYRSLPYFYTLTWRLLLQVSKVNLSMTDVLFLYFTAFLLLPFVVSTFRKSFLLFYKSLLG